MDVNLHLCHLEKGLPDRSLNLLQNIKSENSIATKIGAKTFKIFIHFAPIDSRFSLNSQKWSKIRTHPEMRPQSFEDAKITHNSTFTSITLLLVQPKA